MVSVQGSDLGIGDLFSADRICCVVVLKSFKSSGTVPGCDYFWLPAWSPFSCLEICRSFDSAPDHWHTLCSNRRKTPLHICWHSLSVLIECHFSHELWVSACIFPSCGEQGISLFRLQLIYVFMNVVFFSFSLYLLMSRDRGAYTKFDRGSGLMSINTPALLLKYIMTITWTNSGGESPPDRSVSLVITNIQSAWCSSCLLWCLRSLLTLTSLYLRISACHSLATSSTASLLLLSVDICQHQPCTTLDLQNKIIYSNYQGILWWSVII